MQQIKIKKSEKSQIEIHSKHKFNLNKREKKECVRFIHVFFCHRILQYCYSFTATTKCSALLVQLMVNRCDRWRFVS